MSIPTFGRNRPKFKALLGIRARLVLLALILVVPLMVDRVHMLEDERHAEVVQAAKELSDLAKRTAASQREIVMAVRSLLKSSAYVYAAARQQGRGCALLNGGLKFDLPWIRSISVVGADGKILCSTTSQALGLDLSDRDYFMQARSRQEFVLSDYIVSRASGEPITIAVNPVGATATDPGAFIIAAIDLKWMSQLLSDRAARAGISVFMVDSKGVILGAQARSQDMVGTYLQDTALMEAIARREFDLNREYGSISYLAANGEKRAVSFARVDGTSARLIVSVSEAGMLGSIDNKITGAYMQLALFVLLALLGALIVGERLIIRPVKVMTAAANKFGNGDLTARAPKSGVPWEFAPLASAFNVMASRLAERERDMMAANDRLMVMASVDVTSGLANRRGFQSRLEFEWMKAQQTQTVLSLMMIDVDHFKTFNDNYGHPEGDACLARIGQTLSQIAIETSGFAARYGGEEFCLLLPDGDTFSARRAGEHIRASIEQLAIPHSYSPTKVITVSVGVASIAPTETQREDQLVEAADAALYAAKRRGRNTVVEHGLIRATDQEILLESWQAPAVPADLQSDPNR